MRVAIVFDHFSTRNPAVLANIGRAIGAATETEIIAVIVRDEIECAELIQAHAAKDRVRIVRVGDDDEMSLKEKLIDLGSDFYYWTNGTQAIDLTALSNHCRGDREVQIFGANKPFFFDSKPDMEPLNDKLAKHGNLEVFSLLMADNMAVSSGFIKRTKIPNFLSDPLAPICVFDACASFTVNSADISERTKELDWRFIALRYAHAFFATHDAIVANKIVEYIERPNTVWRLTREAKWAVSTKAYIGLFASLLSTARENRRDQFLLPYQGHLQKTIENSDYRSLIELIERMGKNRFARTELRSEDFFDRPLPAPPEEESTSPIDVRSDGFGDLVREKVLSKFSLGARDKGTSDAATAATSSFPLTQLDFRYTSPGGFGSHRDGWAFVMQTLLEGVGHSKSAIGFDGFIEKTFVWNFGNTAIDRDKSWVGFTHRPPNIPQFYDWKSRLQFYESPYYALAADQNAGLIAVSSSHAKFLSNLLGKPVTSVLHPTNHNVSKWDPEILSNDTFDVVQIGSWLRKLHSIFLLSAGDYKKKILVKSKRALFENDRFRGEAEYLSSKGKVSDAIYDTVEYVSFLPDAAYDELLTRSVVFLDLYDATANNTVLECIARHTPIVVRRLPATEEYLGKKYPLFFESLEEAAALLGDRDGLLAAHKYLVKRSTLPDFHARGFVENVQKAINKFGLL